MSRDASVAPVTLMGSKAIEEQLAALERDRQALEVQLDAHPLRQPLRRLERERAAVREKLQQLEAVLAEYESERRGTARRPAAVSVPLVLALSAAVAIFVAFVLRTDHAPQAVSGFAFALLGAGLTGYFRGR